MSLSVTSKPFGRLKDGRAATLYTLTNGSGASVTFSDFGAALVSAYMPDKHGQLGPVVLGFDNIGQYEDNPAYVGVVIGPVANRIGEAEFSIGGAQYRLEKNDGENCLHSGEDGWHLKLWTVDINSAGLRFTLETVEGENGFPGKAAVKIDASLSEDNQLIYRMRAASDAPTPIAMTRHEYFNLADGGESAIDNHTVTIAAQDIAQLDAQNIATGKLISVDDIGINLGRPTTLSAAKDNNGVLAFDYHFIIAGRGLRHMARIESPQSGRRLDVHATADGLQFYTGQHMPKLRGRSGIVYGPSCGFALEPQARPNAVNIPSFPSIILNPDAEYDETIIYKFSLID